MKPWTYEDRWAVITGASAGLGEAFAHALAAKGMHLILAARREPRMRALADALAKSHGIETRVIAVDLGQEEGPERLFREASEGREIHLLVNNAGFGLQGRFEELALERQLAMIALDVSALTELTGLFLPAMQERGSGAILQVSSGVAFQPVPLMAAYAASKAFVLSLSEALAVENEDLGVRVMALCPGGVPTEFQEVAGARLPAVGVMPASAVVEQALRGLERGRSVVIPGLINKGAPLASRLLPRELVARAAKLFVERLK